MTDREEIKSRVLAAVREGNSSSAEWKRAKCPFCLDKLGKSDRRGAFSLNVITGVYHCFRCGTAGRIRGDEYLDDDEARAIVPVAPRIQPPPHFILLSSPAGKALCIAPAWKYLRSRGLTDALIKQAGIGACPTGPMAGRVIVPLIADDGTWLWWVGRAWTKKSEKPYMYPKGSRADVFYNHAALLVETDKPVMVVEGAFDALALWPDAVAVLGKPGHAQIEALVSARRPVAIVLDGDAWEEGAMLSMRLRLDGQRAGNVKLGPRLDPDEVDRQWLDEEVRKCIEA